MNYIYICVCELEADLYPHISSCIIYRKSMPYAIENGHVQMANHQGSIGSGSGLGSGQLSAKSLEGQGLFLNLATTGDHGHGEIPGNPERMEAIEAISWEYFWDEFRMIAGKFSEVYSWEFTYKYL